MKSSRVRGVTAAPIASRSTRPSASGTVTTTASRFWGSRTKLGNDGQARPPRRPARERPGRRSRSRRRRPPPRSPVPPARRAARRAPPRARTSRGPGSDSAPAPPSRSPRARTGTARSSPSLSPSEATPGASDGAGSPGGSCSSDGRTNRAPSLTSRRARAPGGIRHRGGLGRLRSDRGDGLPVAPVVAPSLLPTPPEEAAAHDRPRTRSQRSGCRRRGRRANDSPSPATKPATAAVPRLRISRLRYHQPIDIAIALRRELSEPNISGASAVGGWPGRGRRALPP